MKRPVRLLIQIIAAALMVFGALEIGLEIVHHQVQVHDHANPIHTNIWRYIIGALLFAFGIVLFLGSNSLADQLTDDYDDEDDLPPGNPEE